MPLAITILRTANGPLGKETLAEVTFDAIYPTGGEVFDLAAAPFTGVNAFTSTIAVDVVEGPYEASTFAPIAQTLCCKIQYDAAAGRAVGTGTLVAFAENGTSGVTTEVADTTDLSTVLCRVRITGT